MKGIWWIKRDLRIYDNESLHRGSLECDELLPFFCWETEVIEALDYSAFHLQAQWQALNGLRKSLRVRKSDVWEDSNDIIKALIAIRRSYQFEVIYSHQETGNLITFARDRRVLKWCRDHGLRWVESKSCSVLRGGNAENKREKVGYKDYRELPEIPIPSDLKFPSKLKVPNPAKSWEDLVCISKKFSGERLSSDLQVVNEQEAWNTMESFLSIRGKGYSGGISSPNNAFVHGSRLSPHLAWGTMSLRSVFCNLNDRTKYLKENNQRDGWLRSLRAFRSRLYWRDHFIQRLEAFPELEELPLNPAYEKLEYDDSDKLMEAWVSGNTGFPMVDACMRCLHKTGFLNFRMRAMVVSFACFGLHLSWKSIHPKLANLFLDYEPGIHLSQIQMQAGVIGFNTIRVYSPSKQFIDQDPDGAFVKKWIPELRNRTPVEIANVEKNPLSGYPEAVVDLAKRSKEMKKRIFDIRRSAEGMEITKKVLKEHGSRKGGKKLKRQKENQSQLALFKS